ncbi:hypothetical protein OH76DRAFT_1468827 [Lentinus brumalis]|uniref:BTB domain-containing protein n=1 Tax=Lentinus brumalis TaxID=2498619 RepID=A0A371DSS3_9APHY|nr:hypothetical protein OH76DRAFT_1468827 [Polyporus brumalis]
MLSNARPSNHRASPSVSSISKPMPLAQPLAASPPTSPKPKGKTRRPSVTSPMTWLTRASSSASIHSLPYAPSRPVRISEPRFANPVEALTLPRSGVLGGGATVVRTPQEALAGPRASASSPDLLASPSVRSPSPGRLSEREHEDYDGLDRPDSPPLPPIPDSDMEYVEEEQEDAEEAEADSDTVDWHQSAPMPALAHPPPPTRPPPSLPSISDFDSELAPVRAMSPSSRARSVKSPLDCFPSVPPLPAGVLTSRPQSPFGAILVSPAPNSSPDPAKIIVSLETSTATHRTTMSTLVSRPSHLASYLVGLFPSAENDTHSVYSTASEVDSSFNSIFNHHLASTGILAQASTNLHIFLDRPSAPYAHILTYLRSPVSTSEAPAILPHGARLNGSTSRLEALLELRDEAAYLGLEELQKLCTDELRHRHPSPSGSLNGLGLHMRGFSNASSKSLHTLRETPEPPAESEVKSIQRKSDDSGFASSGAGTRKSGGSAEADAPWPSPGSLKERVALKEASANKDGFSTLKARPTGPWI